MTSLAGAGYRAWGGMRDTAGRNAARKAALEACTWVWRTTRQWQLPPLASRQRHVTTLMWGTPAPRSVAGKAAGQGRTRLAVGMGVGCNGSEGFEPSMQGEMRHAAQLNAGLLNRAVIARNECEAALQFARDLLYSMC